MKLAQALAVAGIMTFGGVAPAQAQEAGTAESWVNWSSRLSGEALETLAYPFRQAWKMAWDVIGNSEAEIAAEKTKFAKKLKSELADFSKEVGRVGYDLTIISISPDVIPKISLTLEVNKPVNEAAETALRAEFQNREKYGAIESAILQGLLDLDETAADLKADGYRFSGVDLELIAIFPEVTLNFEREDLSPLAPEPPKTVDSTGEVLSD